MKILIPFCLLILLACNKNDDSVSPEIELQNEPPLSFNLVDVPDGATDVDVLPTLSWESAKNPEGTEVTYDLYLGKETNPTNLLQSGISETSYQIDERLNLISDYYWKVVARDANGQSSQSAIYKFSTRNIKIAEEPIVAEAPFSSRSGHSAIVYENKLWMIAGSAASPGDFGSIRQNDVWSSPDGINWTEITASAPFSARNNHTSVVFDNRVWVIGGFRGDGYFNDVWHSDDGINWTQATTSANFTARLSHSSVVFDNKMWVIAGSDGGTKNDVWSSGDGINWTEVTSNANFPKRSGHASVVFDDKIWVLGGSTLDENNEVKWFKDVWYSSDGINWTETTNAAEFLPRTSHTLTVFDNMLWLLGGSSQEGTIGGISYSMDGVRWQNINLTSHFSPKTGHAALVFDRKLWSIGGFPIPSNGPQDIWTFD